MSRWRDNLSMHWPLPVGLLLFAPVVWRYVALAQWEKHLETMALATLAFMSVVAADEVASYTGRYGWTYESFWTYPPTWVRTAGIAMLIWANLFGFAG